MSYTGIESLLTEVAGESPAGPNLEYDPRFGELERTAQPKAERVIGDVVTPAEEPDWEEVANQAEALLIHTKDLRVALILCTAWLRRHGFAGFAAGLRLLHELLSRYWDGVHPQLDAEDNNDPTLRLNSLEGLNDTDRLLRYVRDTPFVQSSRLGRFSLRDLRAATSGAAVAEGAPPQPKVTDIEAACTDADLDGLQATAADLAVAVEQVKEIEFLLNDNLSGSGSEFKSLRTDLRDIGAFLNPRIAARTGVPAVDGAEGAAAGSGAVPGAIAVGAIAGNADVVRVLDQICAFYERAEPSSPVPLLLRRARDMVGKTFLDLVKNIAPGGLGEVMALGRVDESGERT